MGAAFAAPANASDASPTSTDIFDPIATMSSIVPDVLAETTANDGHVQIGGGSTSRAARGQSNARVSLDPIFDGDTTISEGVAFEVDYATTLLPSNGGAIDVLSTEHDSVAAYVQPLNSGVRVLTAIADASAPTEYSYTVDVPADAELQEAPAGFHLMSETQVYITLSDAWAKDANGRDVPTEFSWDNGVLTQHVDLSAPGIRFPVVADPRWGYVQQFSIARTATSAWNQLNACFKCEFPLSGAPTAFPSSNQLMRLRMPIPAVGRIFNFDVRRAQVFRTPPNYYAFQLNATADHIDGAGSRIIFEIRNTNFARLLIVDAYVVNDFYFGNDTYRLGARLQWQAFADNLSKL